MERIVAVAVRHVDGEIVSLPAPNRHNDVIQHIGERFQIWRREGYEMGFLTDTGDFVGRFRAKQIAERARQLLPRASGLRELFSEDVW